MYQECATEGAVNDMSGSKSFWVYSGGMDLTVIALEYSKEKAQRERVIYISASKEKAELEKYMYTDKSSYLNLEVSDIPAPAIEDILARIWNMLADTDKVYCVIDHLPLLCSRQRVFNSRQEEIISILESINQFVAEHNAHFLILLPISLAWAKNSTVEMELTCYGPIDLFGNDYYEVKNGIPFEFDGKRYEAECV